MFSSFAIAVKVAIDGGAVGVAIDGGAVGVAIDGGAAVLSAPAMGEAALIFLVADQRLALPAASVRECLPLPVLWRRAGAPVHVAGFFSLGGRMMPVLDLAVLLGLRRETKAAGLEQAGLYRHLLHVGDAMLLVDRAVGFAQCGEGLEVLDADPWQHGCVKMRFLADGGPVALLDPETILLEDERTRLATLSDAASVRAEGWRDAV